MPKTVKEPSRFFSIHYVAKYQKIGGGPFRDIKKFSKKVSSQSRKGGFHSAEKSGNLLLRNACKKLAHTHRFDNEPSGLKSKHLTTRPRMPELRELRAETKELSRGKKAPALPHNTCL